MPSLCLLSGELSLPSNSLLHWPLDVLLGFKDSLQIASERSALWLLKHIQNVLAEGSDISQNCFQCYMFGFGCETQPQFSRLARSHSCNHVTSSQPSPGNNLKKSVLQLRTAERISLGNEAETCHLHFQSRCPWKALCECHRHSGVRATPIVLLCGFSNTLPNNHLKKKKISFTTFL